MSPLPLPFSFGGPSPRSRWTLPGRCRGDAQRLAARQRRHLDLAAAQRLNDADRHLDLEVLALLLEDRRGRHVGDHVEVAGRAAALSGLALAGEADPAAVVDARPGC